MDAEEKNNTTTDVVEPENLGESRITIPFDPSDIEVDTSTVNLGHLLNQLEIGKINLTPDFQRAADLWPADKKSRLIESILLGIPIPSFYMSEDQNGKLDIIDGLQRLCALSDFVFGKEKDGQIEFLKLSGLEFLNEKSNKSYDGITYAKLTREEQLRIAGYKITTNTIKKATPSLVKYIIFQRVNTAGVPLTDQEMRHALNQGLPAKFVQKLAETPEFKDATENKIKPTRMEDRDFANRFLGFYLPGNLPDLLVEYKEAGDLNAFLNGALVKIGDSGRLRIDLDRVEDDFRAAMTVSLRIFGNDTFRKRNSIEDQRKPISKSVFDTISVNIAWLRPDERDALELRSNVFKAKLMELFNEKDFSRAISYATGQYWSVDTRFRKVNELIQKILLDD